jgi:hypothetical protein
MMIGMGSNLFTSLIFDGLDPKIKETRPSPSPAVDARPSFDRSTFSDLVCLSPSMRPDAMITKRNAPDCGVLLLLLL